MKKLTVVLALILVFVAFADDSEDYFPTGIGYTWTYQDSGAEGIDTTFSEQVGTEMMMGYETWITEETFDGSVDSSYMQIRTDGVYFLVSFFDSLGSDRRAIQVAPAVVNVGDSWTAADIETSMVMSGYTMNLEITINMEVIGREEVFVPAGGFESCLKLASETEFYYEVSSGGVVVAEGGGVQNRDTTWHAQFVGPAMSHGMDYEIDYMSGEISDSNKTASYLLEYDFTGIDEDIATPDDIAIRAFPNPFNSAVSIQAPDGAEVEVYDINGHRIAELPDVVNGVTRWEPGESVNSGVYFVRAHFDKLNDRGEKLNTERVLLIK